MGPISPVVYPIDFIYRTRIPQVVNYGAIATPAQAPKPKVVNISAYCVAMFQSAINELLKDAKFASHSSVHQLPGWMTSVVSLFSTQAIKETDLFNISMSSSTQLMFRKAIAFFQLEKQVGADQLVAFFRKLDDANEEGITWQALEKIQLEDIENSAARLILLTLKNDPALFRQLAALDGDATSLSSDDLHIAISGQDKITISAHITAQLRVKMKQLGKPVSSSDKNICTILAKKLKTYPEGLSLSELEKLDVNKLSQLSKPDKKWLKNLQEKETQEILKNLISREKDLISFSAFRAYWVLGQLKNYSDDLSKVTLQPQLFTIEPMGREKSIEGTERPKQQGGERFASPKRKQLVDKATLDALKNIIQRNNHSLVFKEIQRVKPSNEHENRALVIISNMQVFLALSCGDNNPIDLSMKDLELYAQKNMLVHNSGRVTNVFQVFSVESTNLK